MTVEKIQAERLAAAKAAAARAQRGLVARVNPFRCDAGPDEKPVCTYQHACRRRSAGGACR